jgi:hypothetical protein
MYFINNLLQLPVHYFSSLSDYATFIHLSDNHSLHLMLNRGLQKGSDERVKL